MERSNAALDVIITFISAMHSEEEAIIGYGENKTDKIHGLKYLLGQIIRQYELPPEQYYVSKAAQSLWNSVSKDNLWDYYYQKYVKCENEKPVAIAEYRGNEKRPFAERNVALGDGFVFRNVFHDEHMIPVTVIVEELLKLEKPDYENVRSVLSNLYICRILKSEDKSIPKKWNRPYDFRAVSDMYRDAGIEIIKRSQKNDG